MVEPLPIDLDKAAFFLEGGVLSPLGEFGKKGNKGLSWPILEADDLKSIKACFICKLQERNSPAYPVI